MKSFDEVSGVVCVSTRVRSIGRLGVCLLMAATVSAAFAQTSLFVPNHSFESQVAAAPFYVDTRVDSWQKPAKPAYFDEAAFGFQWDQTAGVFLDTNPYGNVDGSQGAYLLAFPQVGLFQDYNTLDWSDTVPSHDFDSLYVPGNAYTLTVGVFGKDMTDGSQLSLSLYYRDGLDNMVTVGSTTVTYQAAAFPEVPPLNLLDFSVTTPVVDLGDAWVGQHIGVKIESVYGTGAGYWDIDNVRLTAVPEPGSVGLAMLGLGALFGSPWRRQQSAARATDARANG